MKKKILCLAMTVIMAAGVHTTAFAKDYQGADGWQVHFTGDKMESNFENKTVSDELATIQPGDSIEFEDYELQKAFSGVSTHESTVRVPIFDNDQDIERLAAKVQPWLEAHPDCVGYLIRGHGLYTWGARMSDALRQIEAFEFLFECELKTRSVMNRQG